jgi:hypothetical protein
MICTAWLPVKRKVRIVLAGLLLLSAYTEYCAISELHGNSGSCGRPWGWEVKALRSLETTDSWADAATDREGGAPTDK